MNPQPKIIYYRNKKLTESAKYEACVSCGADDRTIVWAHSNSQRHGKGMGIKAHDLFGAYLCQKCHFDYDDKTNLLGQMSKYDWDEWFIKVWGKSMIIACNNGYLE
jgi:transposase-like protein